MVLTIAIMLAQSYARPFESTDIDRLQTVCLSVEALMLLIGMLFGTLEGQDRPSLIAMFFVVFGFTMVACILAAVGDVRKYNNIVRLTKIANERGIKGFNAKMFSIGVLNPWMSTADEDKLNLLQRFIEDYGRELEHTSCLLNGTCVRYYKTGWKWSTNTKNV